ncbi:hypothetical protein AB5N19_11227 [Seiridium cardinale]
MSSLGFLSKVVVVMIFGVQQNQREIVWGEGEINAVVLNEPGESGRLPPVDYEGGTGLEGGAPAEHARAQNTLPQVYCTQPSADDDPPSLRIRPAHLSQDQTLQGEDAWAGWRVESVGGHDLAWGSHWGATGDLGLGMGAGVEGLSRSLTGNVELLHLQSEKSTE